MWSCPICARPLRETAVGLCCEQGHSFDRSRSGYVHLLPANRKHGKMPGDNRKMVDARRAFLSRGHYAPLADCLCATTTRWTEAGDYLDVGCGEGYYTGRIAAALTEKLPLLSAAGIDISKQALTRAAKSCPAVSFAVASAFHLPLPESCCGAVTNVFAPFCREELLRVLRPGGALVMAIPGEMHLWELKSQIYVRPYKNQVKPFDIDGFDLMKTNQVRYSMELNTPEELRELFLMTPYYYKTGREDQEKLFALSRLTVTAEFIVLAYRRSL